MDKLSFIEKYYYSNLALLLYLNGIIYNNDDNKNAILNADCIKGAKVGIISNILLLSKEEIVSKEINVTYTSKLLSNALEACVEKIAIKEDDKYILDNFKFDSAAELVAELRNKVAHGDYGIDFINNNLVLNIENNFVRINIDKLANFAMNAAIEIYANPKIKNFSRTLFSSNKRYTPSINCKYHVESVIKNCEAVTFNIISNDEEIPKDCIDYFNKKVGQYYYNISLAEQDISYYLEKYNCIFNITKQPACKDSSPEEIDAIATYIMKSIDIKKMIPDLKERFIHDTMKKFGICNFIPETIKASNGYNLFILDKVRELNTIDISKQLIKNYNIVVFDEYLSSMAAISMFTALFSYGFDNVYKNTNEYTDQPNNGLDYSILDLSLLNVLNINDDSDSKVKIKDNECIAKGKKLDRINDSIVRLNNQTKKIFFNKNIKFLLRIEKLRIIREKIKDEFNQKKILSNKLIDAQNESKMIKSYIENNSLYLKNKTIIEGIRNSIAHGNYKLVFDKDISNIKIVFNDIYEGKTTFKAEILAYDFPIMLNTNFEIIFNKRITRKDEQKALNLNMFNASNKKL